MRIQTSAAVLVATGFLALTGFWGCARQTPPPPQSHVSEGAPEISRTKSADSSTADMDLQELRIRRTRFRSGGGHVAAPFSEALLMLCGEARVGVNVAVDPRKLGAPEPKVSLIVAGDDFLGDVLDRMTRQANLRYVIHRDVVFISDEETIGKFRDAAPPRLDSDQDKETFRKLQERRVSSLVCLRQPAMDALRMTAAEAEVDLEIQGGERLGDRPVMLQMNQVQAGTVLDLIMLETGLHYTLRRGVVVVSENEAAQVPK